MTSQAAAHTKGLRVRGLRGASRWVKGELVGKVLRGGGARATRERSAVRGTVDGDTKL